MSSALSRREVLAGLLAAAACGCDARPAPKGRQVAALWFAYGGKNRQILERLVGKFNDSQGDVFVHATFQGDYFECLAKLRTAIAANAAPVMSHVVGEVVPYLHQANVLEPMNDYPGAGSLNLLPALAQSGTYVGGDEKPLVALPFNRSTPLMYLNTKVLASHGFGAPQSWSDLVSMAKALTRRTSSGQVERWGFECPISWWFWVALVGQAGGTVMSPEGDPLLGGEAGIRAIELWQKMIYEEKCMRPPPGRDYDAWQETNKEFLTEWAAIIFTSTAFLRYIEENARFPVTAAQLPGDVRRAVPTGGTFFVMLRSAKQAEKQAAWRFLRWMMEPPQTIEWATGTGYMPVQLDAVKKLEADGYYKAHPNDRVTIDQLAHAQKWPWAPNLFRVQREIMDPRLEEAVLVPRNARQILEIARAEALKE